MLTLDFTLGAHLDMTLLQPARTLDCCFRLVLRLGQRGGRRSRTGIYLAQHISSALGPFAREMAQPSPAQRVFRLRTHLPNLLYVVI
jgi:hypothetical protein